MSFDRAAIERHLEDLDRYEPMTAARDLLRACLAEIDRQAAIMCAAIDDAPGYPCGCSHELDADGVVTATHTRCEAHRRAEAQAKQLRQDMMTLAALYDTDRVAHQQAHQIEKIFDCWDDSAVAETEGP